MEEIEINSHSVFFLIVESGWLLDSKQLEEKIGKITKFAFGFGWT